MVFAVVIVALVMQANEQPRRWVTSNPLRIDGYLEMLGREERVVRLRVLVRFANRAGPEAELFKDLLTGASVFTRGVELIDHGVFAVHSPEINGHATASHCAGCSGCATRRARR